jgi:hypothetical protein
MTLLESPVALAVKEPGALEDVEVLRDGGQRNGKRRRELAHRDRATEEALDDSATRAVGERLKHGVELVVVLGRGALA